MKTHVVRRGLLGGAILFAGCLLLVSCSSGGTTSSPAASGVQALPAPAKVPASDGATATGLSRQVGQTAALTPASQSIIYTASLTLRSADVTSASRRAVSIAAAAGGYVAGEHETSGSAGGRDRRVNLTLKIPVPAYQDALAQLSSGALGRQVSLQQQATDVTEQVADVNSLVTSQQDAIAALRGLLSKASSVSGLLQVQQQISSDESDLNSLQAQQRALDHETSYATVTMTLLSPRAAGHKKAAARHGFVAGLAAGWAALRHATGWVLTALGAALPFLVILALLAAGGFLGWRRFGRGRTRPTTAS